MNTLTIDPGIQGTGYAVWDFKGTLIKCGVIVAPGKYIWEEKMHSIAHELTNHTYRCEKVYIEYPQKFGGVMGDMVSNKGDLGKLFTCAGYFIGYLRCPFELVPVNKWKGQLPKRIVNQRVEKILSEKEQMLLSVNHSHDWDAVGIGLYVQGRL